MFFYIFYFVIGLTIDFSLFLLVCPGRRLTPATLTFPDRKTVVFPSRLARRVCVLSATGLDGYISIYFQTILLLLLSFIFLVASLFILAKCKRTASRGPRPFPVLSRESDLHAPLDWIGWIDVCAPTLLSAIESHNTFGLCCDQFSCRQRKLLFFENEEEGNVIKKGMRLFGSASSVQTPFSIHTVHTTSLPSP